MIEIYEIICLFLVCRALVNSACSGFPSDPCRAQEHLASRKINIIELEGILQEPRVQSII